MDKNGRPFASYLRADDYHLTVVHCTYADCSGFSATELESIPTPGYSSLSLDRDGHPVVSYEGSNGSKSALKLVHCGDEDCSFGSLSIVTVDDGGPSGDEVGSYNSLVLDEDGRPVVSYYDKTNHDLKLVHCAHASCANAAPVVTNPSYTVATGDILVGGATTGVLASAYDPDPEDAGLLTADLLQSPEHGRLVSFGKDGSFAYQPDQGFFGTDRFTYVVSDGSLQEDGLATIQVQPFMGDMSLQASPATVTAGGTATVTGTVYDLYGDPKAGMRVELSTDAGFITGHATTGSDGSFEATFVAPGQARSVTITATVAGSQPLVQRALTLSVEAGTPGGGPGGGGPGGGTGGTVGLASPAVREVQPDEGPATGGTRVKITGTRLAGATAVLFGARHALRFTVVSDEEIDAVAPPGLGTVDVVVAGPGGAGGATTPAATFTYLQEPAVPFADLPPGHWAYGHVQLLAELGAVSGFADGSSRPDAPVTRAEFVKMLAVALDIAPGDGATAFTDVPPGAWFAPYVSACVAAGLVQGTSATTFSPNAYVTREEVAVLIDRALDLAAGDALPFTDVDAISPWARDAVRATYAAHILGGYPDRTFRPRGLLSRAEAAAVLARAIERLAASAS